MIEAIADYLREVYSLSKSSSFIDTYGWAGVRCEVLEFTDNGIVSHNHSGIIRYSDPDFFPRLHNLILRQYVPVWGPRELDYLNEQYEALHGKYEGDKFWLNTSPQVEGSNAK